MRRLKRSVWASGHLHALGNDGHRPPVAWMVTLTYADAEAWRANHVSAGVQRFRDWCRSRGYPVRYTWVAEIQPKRARERGEFAVHYHFVAWLPGGVAMPKWDAAGWWRHGMTQREQCRTGVGYLMKYLSKLGELTRFPKGLRLYGIGGLNGAARDVRRWHTLPQWAQAAYGVGDLCRRAGRLVVQATGEVLAPVYSVSRVPGGLELRKLRDVPARFPELAALGVYPGAWSTWDAPASVS